MTRSLVNVALAAITTTGIVAGAPTAASASTAERSAAAAGAASAVERSATEASAAVRPHLLSYKVYFGKCEDTCRIKVRIKNVSRKKLYNVSLNARLWINGKKVGACYDHIGSIRPKKVRWGGCTVRSAKLARMWTRYLDGEIDFNAKTKTDVYYQYYR